MGRGAPIYLKGIKEIGTTSPFSLEFYIVVNGEVAEWSNAAVSKTVARRMSGRELESLPLRHLIWQLSPSRDKNFPR